jgi:hypothetical protein
MSSHLRPFVLLSLLLALATGCSSDDGRNLPRDRLWESTHFRYHTRADDSEPCEAVLVQLERHFELIQGYLGFSWPSGRKVDYYKFRDKADYLSSGFCPEDSDSCTRDSEVMSPHVLQDHELIHAYLAPLGMPPALFVEGAAVVLACDHVFALQNFKPWQDVATEAFGVKFGRAYYEGTWFVGYLLDRFGPASFLALYGRLDYRTATADTMAAAFASVYGESLDAVWNASLASSDRIRCVNLWNCAGANLPLDGSIQPLESACDGSANSRTFELDSDTDALILSHRYFLYAPLSCDEKLPTYVGGANESYEFGTVFNPTVVTIPAGKYFIKSAAQGGVPDVGVLPLPVPTYSRECGQLHALDLSGEEFWKGDIELSIPNDGHSWYLKLHPASGHTFYTGSYATEEVQECSSCGATPACVPLVDNAHPDADGNVILRLTSPTSGPGTVEYMIRASIILP